MLFAAIIYNTIYLMVMFEWIIHLIDTYFEKDGGEFGESEKIETIDMILHLITGYNVLLHWPAWTLNSVIMFKEFSLQFF